MIQILVVEDDLGMGRLIGATLGGSQVEVSHAVDGEQALTRAHSAPPDLVVLDVNLLKPFSPRVLLDLVYSLVETTP
jgi:DNA-binding response OmpR family regulator